MSDFKSITGQVLWQWLPEVYRNRDESEEFAALFDSFGYLMDSVRATQDQRLADCFPDNPLDPDQRACQDWLLPYFAKLLDARLVSPHVRGRRDEVANAIYWRQRKGTFQGVEAIAESISQKEFIIHEGYKRVAITPRIDIPYLHPKVLGYPEKENLNNDPASRAKNPALPHVTIDFRYICRAHEVADIHLAPHVATFDDTKVGWKYTDPQGRPCFIDSYEDNAPRTVDFRDPQWNQGLYHPKRVLLFTPPEIGIFKDSHPRINWADWSLHPTLFNEESTADKVILSNPSTPDEEGAEYEDYERLNFIDGPLQTEYSSYKTLCIRDMNFMGTLTLRGQTIILENVAVEKLNLNKLPNKKLKLIARHCLFDEIEVSSGEVELEYCTVMGPLEAKILNASDCIFMGPITLNDTNINSHCVRYSRISDNINIPEPMIPSKGNNTSDMPIYFDNYATDDQSPVFCDSANNALIDLLFGHQVYGVLHPATPTTITEGAEDGGEMGAFHSQYHRQQIQAILTKYTDYLPVDMEPVIIEDYRLLRKPITITP